MAGTKLGGIHARDTNITKYGRDFYARIGAIGGRKGHTGGFYANRELARLAGGLGGSISRRGGQKLNELQRLKVRKAYEELMAIHLKAKRERQAYTVA